MELDATTVTGTVGAFSSSFIKCKHGHPFVGHAFMFVLYDIKLMCVSIYLLFSSSH